MDHFDKTLSIGAIRVSVCAILSNRCYGFSNACSYYIAPGVYCRCRTTVNVDLCKTQNLKDRGPPGDSSGGIGLQPNPDDKNHRKTSGRSRTRPRVFDISYVWTWNFGFVLRGTGAMSQHSSTAPLPVVEATLKALSC